MNNLILLDLRQFHRASIILSPFFPHTSERFKLEPFFHEIMQKREEDLEDKDDDNNRSMKRKMGRNSQVFMHLVDAWISLIMIVFWLTDGENK